MAVLLKLINMESMARTKNRDWVGQTALTPDFNVAHFERNYGGGERHESRCLVLAMDP